MTEYLKELEKGCGKKINIYYCHKNLHCLACSKGIEAYKKGFSDGEQKGCKDTEDKFRIWLEDLLITNWEVEKVKEKIKELSGNNDCDCKMMIGGSGKLCPKCEGDKT